MLYSSYSGRKGKPYPYNIYTPLTLLHYFAQTSPNRHRRAQRNAASCEPRAYVQAGRQGHTAYPFR